MHHFFLKSEEKRKPIVTRTCLYPPPLLPRFASVTRNYFKISLFHWIICVLRDWRVRASTLVLVLRHLIKTRSKLCNWYWFSTAMEVKHFLLLILFQRMITAQMFGDVEDPPYFRSAFFETKENRRLYGRVFKRFESQSAISCTCSCIETDWCSSTNFKVYSKDEDNGTCELNEHSIIDENTELHDEEGVTFSIPFKVICSKPSSAVYINLST